MPIAKHGQRPAWIVKRLREGTMTEAEAEDTMRLRGKAFGPEYGPHETPVRAHPRRGTRGVRGHWRVAWHEDPELAAGNLGGYFVRDFRDEVAAQREADDLRDDNADEIRVYSTNSKRFYRYPHYPQRGD